MKMLKSFWCNVFHGGGDIARDEHGRINWRCRKCGRFSDFPVSHAEENAVILREMLFREVPERK